MGEKICFINKASSRSYLKFTEHKKHGQKVTLPFHAGSVGTSAALQSELHHMQQLMAIPENASTFCNIKEATIDM